MSLSQALNQFAQNLGRYLVSSGVMEVEAKLLSGLRIWG